MIIDPRDNPGDTLCRAVKRALDEEIRRIVEEECRLATVRVEERVRESAGGIATKVANYVTYERFGTELKITVQLK